MDKLNRWTSRADRATPGTYITTNLTPWSYCECLAADYVTNGSMIREVVERIVTETFNLLGQDEDIIFLLPDNQPEVLDWLTELAAANIRRLKLRKLSISTRTIGQHGDRQVPKLVPLKLK